MRAMGTATTLVFIAVVGARFLVPLLIPRYPLPAIIASLALDGYDQTIFQAFGYDPPGYQSYDKAMDVYYLAIAYLANDAQLGAAPCVPDRTSAVLLPARRGGRVRAAPGPRVVADLREHLRVLLHRLRGSALALVGRFPVLVPLVAGVPPR